jgi:hypothetical protein
MKKALHDLEKLKALVATNIPRTRSECENGPRPCPHVSCRYNLYLDVQRNGTISVNFPHISPEDMPPSRSCALDMAESARTLEQVGEAMNLTRERIRTIETSALLKIRRALSHET